MESEAIVRLELAASLADMGLNVLSTSSAEEAIDLLQTHSEIRLMLTDIRMPGATDGLWLARQVRHRWPPVRIIVISGMIDIRRSQLPDDCVFIAKPYFITALSDALFPYSLRLQPAMAEH